MLKTSYLSMMEKWKMENRKMETWQYKAPGIDSVGTRIVIDLPPHTHYQYTQQ